VRIPHPHHWRGTLLLLSLLLLGCSATPSAIRSASQDNSKPSQHQGHGTNNPVAPPQPTGPVPLLLGMRPLQDEFRLDDSLRLQIPLPASVPALRAQVVNVEPTPLTKDRRLLYWSLESTLAEKHLPTRVGMILDCISPSLRFQGVLENYELWQDDQCGETYLIAVIRTPNDDQLRDPAQWVALPHPVEVPLVPIEESLEITEPPPAPDNLVGLYDRVTLYLEAEVRALQEAAVAAATESAGTVRTGEDPPLADEGDEENSPASDAPDLPIPASDVRFGRFTPGAEESWMVGLATWMEPPATFQRLLIVMDQQGRERYRIPQERLDRFALQQLFIEFLTDLDGDGTDELIVTARADSGAQQTMIWSLSSGALTILSEGTWWGCQQSAPSLDEQPAALPD